MRLSERAILLNLKRGGQIELHWDEERMPGMAVYWSSALSNRHRWYSDDAIAERRNKAVENARELFPSLNKHFATYTNKLSNAEIVEVQLPPFTRESEDWELRIFPWEFFLSAITREARRLRSEPRFAVCRVLPGGSSAPADHSNGAPLMVISAPGELGGRYSFVSETELVQINLEQADTDFVLQDPTKSGLRKRIKKENPSVIHLAGFERREFRDEELIDEESTPPRTTERDAYVLMNDDHLPVSCEATELADILNSGNPSPALVCFNIRHSASRLAALAIAGGVHTAIGFQDEIDDELAETFFAHFYREWKVQDNDTLTAFVTAFEEVQKLPKNLRMRGSGFVLWSRTSLLSPYSLSSSVPSSSAAEKASKEPRHEWHPRVDIKVVERLNYSILHNRGGLFQRFSITRTSDQSIETVRVQATAHVGGKEFSYRAFHHLEAVGTPTRLHEDIKVPLAWDYLRSIRETLRTTLYVNITREDGQIVHEKTYPIELSPLEAWSDTDQHRIWLPSFVLPRDPVVARIIEQAGRYLIAIADDTTVGFDGYQSVGIEYDNPYAAVDQQVRSIWTALLLEAPLTYSNPPPGFLKQTQRLRSPSEIYKVKHGTCIDLALLLAACFEYVNIRSTLFLIDGHAFPGYWRSEAAADRFLEGLPVDVDLMSTDDVSPDDNRLMPTSAAASTDGWVFQKSDLALILDNVAAGCLQPLESTHLTANGSFWQACEDGLAHLADENAFNCMMDVFSAHNNESGSRPLPIMYGDLS